MKNLTAKEQIQLALDWMNTVEDLTNIDLEIIETNKEITFMKKQYLHIIQISVENVQQKEQGKMHYIYLRENSLHRN